MLYQGFVQVRDEYVSGVGPWVWARDDVHGWIGPKMDWEVHHSQNIARYCSTRLGPRSVAVQAGGCMGMYPRLLSDMFNAVYTFEPDPLNFHCLVANCQRDNIVKMNAALGERPARAAPRQRRVQDQRAMGQWLVSGPAQGGLAIGPGRRAAPRPDRYQELVPACGRRQL